MCLSHMKVGLKNQITWTNNLLRAFPHCADVPDSPLCSQRFSRALLSLVSFLLSLALHLLKAILAIFFASAHWEQNGQCKGYLLLSSFSAETGKVLMTKSSSSFRLIMLPCVSLGGHWGSQELAETFRNFPEAFMISFVSVSLVTSDTMLVE